MSDTSKKIIEEIHEKNIKPISKRYFVIKNLAVWISLLASVIFGAVSISIEEVIIENANNPYGPAGIGVSHNLINWISFLWFFSTILFMTLAYLNVRSTRDGYRYRAVWIVVSILLVFITLGVFFHHEGIGNRAESLFEAHCEATSPNCPFQ